MLVVLAVEEAESSCKMGVAKMSPILHCVFLIFSKFLFPASIVLIKLKTVHYMKINLTLCAISQC